MDSNLKARGIVIEVIVGIILIIFIAIALNYFNVVNLPFLSSLPTRSENSSGANSANSLDEARSTIAPVIVPSSPFTSQNTTGKSQYKVLPNGGIKVTGELTLDTEIKANTTNNDSSGIMFTNSFKYEDSNFRMIRLFNDKSNNWSLEFRSKGKSEYFFIKKGITNVDKFFVKISKDGRSVQVFSTGDVNQVFKLSSSLYDTSEQMFSTIQVAPNSQIDIFSLYYEY